MACELQNFVADVRVQVGHLPLVNPIERDAVGAELERVLHRDAPPAGFIGGQGDPEKSGQAAPAPVAAASSTEPQKAAATPKKAQRSAHRQNQRRDQNLYGAPSWREVRVDDWGARGYAPRESDYQRGGYGRQGFVRNFW